MNGTARVSSAKISPRRERSRKASAPIARPAPAAEQPADRDREEVVHALPAHEDGRGVGADPDERGLPEAEVAAVAGQDVPARRLGDPEQDEVANTR